MRIVFRSFVALMLIVLVPASTLLADPGAIVRSPAGVQVNGVDAVSGFAIFDGDAIRTRRGSPAIISSSGNVVLLAEDSNLRYSRSGVELSRGSATITTRRAMPSTVTGISIRPTTANGKYELVQRGNEVIVGARQGALEIADATGTLVLKEGMAAAILTQAPASARSSGTNSAKNSQKNSKNEKEPKERRRGRGGAPLPASTQGVPATGVSRAKLYAIVGGIAAGSLIAICLATRGDTSPVCPTATPPCPQ